ncbi:MAG: DNA-processing protein DprA, partial [Deltaproteobacteria bacterium]|nr:DNA-processing protein DprA [Deltaproteobacteria bacterium]
MYDENQRYWTILARVKGVRRNILFDAVKTAVATNGADGAKALVKGELSVSDKLRKAITEVSIAEVDKELKEAERSSASIVTYGDQGYPEMLRFIPSPPLTLYVKGSIDKFNGSSSVAIVGTRRASSYGRNMAEKIAEGLADSGITIVSGLARGCDSAAHKGALLSKTNDFPTVAV